MAYQNLESLLFIQTQKLQDLEIATELIRSKFEKCLILIFNL